MQIANKKWTMDQFLTVRKQVLDTWPTGHDNLLNLDQAVATLRAVPTHKNFALKLLEAKTSGRTFVQPRAGVALVDAQIDLLQTLEAAGADFLPSTIDSYTRHNLYHEAEQGILASKREGRSLLNGFPAVNHGVGACKQVADAVNVPLEARHGTPDARLLSEIIHAAGWTSNEGGGISYNLPYAKNVSLADSIYYWQYCDRLVGFYEEQGISINREPFGPLTGTLVPPCIAISIGIIEALLAAEQGVKNITVGYGQGGNLIQDVASIHVLQRLTEHYLALAGHDDVLVTTVFHQWMGGFPQDRAEASGLIAMASTVAALAGATKMITKTPDESIGVPSKEINAYGIRTSKMVVNLLAHQTLPVSPQLETEEHFLAQEVHDLVKSVYNLGKGDLAQGVIHAFELGVLDVPFAPSRQNQNKVMPARDNDGCIRILEFGSLGLSEDIRAIHRQKLAERGRFEGRDVTFQMTIDDIYAVSNGMLIGRPNGGKKR